MYKFIICACDFEIRSLQFMVWHKLFGGIRIWYAILDIHTHTFQFMRKLKNMILHLYVFRVHMFAHYRAVVDFFGIYKQVNMYLLFTYLFRNVMCDKKSINIYQPISTPRNAYHICGKLNFHVSSSFYIYVYTYIYMAVGTNFFWQLYVHK